MHGGAVFSGSKLDIADCKFRENAAVTGGAIRAVISAEIANSRFLENYASSEGGALYNGAAGFTVVQCVFAGNSAAHGGAMFEFVKFSHDTSVLSSVFHGNSASSEGGGIGVSSFSGPGLAIGNSIFWANSDSSGNLESSQIHASLIPTITYSLIQNIDEFAGDGNISDDPLFVSGNDFRLLPGSPCIDSGNNLDVEVLFDIAGNARFVDDPQTTDTGNGTPPIVDMGPYEFGCNPPPATRLLSTFV